MPSLSLTLVGLQVAVSLRVGVAETTVLVEAAEVGAEGEDHRRGGRHRLVEVQRGKLGLHLCIARHDDAEQLHIAHRGAAARRLQNHIQGLLIHGLLGIFPHAHVVEKGF